MSGLYQIKASAGSGKTYTLTNLFIELLSQSQNLDEIIAITFTNAAAAEMRSRIIRTLKSLALGQTTDPKQNLDPKKASHYLDQILHNLSKLNVGTIDSLLMKIVRSSSLSKHLNPDFTPQFNTEATIDPFLDKLADQARNGDQELLEFLTEVLVNLYQESEARGFTLASKVSSRLKPLFDDILLKRAQGITDLATLKKCRQTLRKEAQSQAEILVQASGLLSNAQKAINNLIDASSENLDFKSTYFKKEHPWELFSKKSPQAKSLQDSDPKVEPLKEAFYSLKAIAKIYPQLSSAIKVRPFISLGERLNAAFMNHPKSSLYLHMVQVPILVRAILEGYLGVSETLFRLGNNLQHLLIDEFQDTSDSQWEAIKPLVIELLAKGGSFTWVGDIKQSIFSWRGGNPRLFDAIYQDQDLVRICGSHLKSDILPCNYRSLKTIVNFNNSLYAPLADPSATLDLIKNLLPDNTPNETIIQVQSLLNQAFAQIKQDLPPKVLESKATGLVEVREVEGEAWLKDLGDLVSLLQEGRKWSEILILTRSNLESNEIAQHLLGLKIPVITENSLLLSQHRLVIQSLAFLRFLVEKDDIALYTVLSGDILAQKISQEEFSLEEFNQMILEEEQPDLRVLLREGWPKIWQDYFEVFVSYSTLLSPYDLLSEWYSFMEVEKHFPQEQAFVQRFLEIVHASEDQGALSLSSFLEYWDNHTEEERVPMPENMEAVRLMTIHKAKGLEAKVVIFPWQQKQMRVDRDIVYKDIEDPNLDLDLHLALRRETIVPEEYYEDYVKRFTESFHLLYVATTRAKEELYVLHIKSGKEEKDSLLQLMEKANLEFPYKAGQKSALTKIVTQEEYPLYQVEVKEIKDLEAWHPMHWLPRLKVTKVTPEEPQAQAKDFGVLFHAALEFVASNYEDPVQSADQALRYALWHTRLKHLVAKDLVENLRESLGWLLSQPLMRKWLSIGFREHSLLTSKGKLLRCDLLVPRDTDWLVVDYKSGEVDEQHLGQMRGYLRGVKSEAKKATGLLVYLEDRLFQKVTLTNASSRVLRLEELGF